MYVLTSSLSGQPIVSLATGELIAIIQKPIISTATLEVFAFRCEVLGERETQILLWRDIRELNPECFIINDETELTRPDDLVRLKVAGDSDTVELNGRTVITDTGRHLGSVHDSSLNIETARVQKLLVRQPLWLRWLSPKCLVDRTQIIDITPNRIIVKDVMLENPILSSKTLPETNP